MKTNRIIKNQIYHNDASMAIIFFESFVSIRICLLFLFGGYTTIDIMVFCLIRYDHLEYYVVYKF